MSAAVFLSRIMGLVREQVFAILFGASHATDAYQIAFRIPNLLRDLFAEGAMSAALVPTFIRTQKEEGQDRGWQLATRVFVVLFCVVSLLAVLAMLFAEPLVALYASAYREVPGKFELTVSMTRIMMPFFPLVALAAAFMAILNALGKFFIPSFASALFNLISVLVGVALTFWFESTGRPGIEGMAYGVIAGGAFQAAVQWPVLVRSGYRILWNQPKKLPVFQDPGLKKMLALMLPGTVGLAATQINILVNSVFATAVGTGAVSWLNYAFRLMQFPIGVFGVSLSSATLPAFSKALAAHELELCENVLQSSLKRTFAINLPASFGLAALGLPIIALIFEHGRFTSHDAMSTAYALAAYSLGLTFYSVSKVLVPVCYALQATRQAVFASFLAVVTNIIFNFALVKPLGFVGLALGTSLTAFLNSVLLAIFISHEFFKLGLKFQWGAIYKSFFIYFCASFLMGTVIYFLDQRVLHESSKWVRVGAGVSVGVAAYMGICQWWKAPEALEVLSGLSRKFFKKQRGK